MPTFPPATLHQWFGRLGPAGFPKCIRKTARLLRAENKWSPIKYGKIPMPLLLMRRLPPIGTPSTNTRPGARKGAIWAASHGLVLTGYWGSRSSARHDPPRGGHKSHQPHQCEQEHPTVEALHAGLAHFFDATVPAYPPALIWIKAGCIARLCFSAGRIACEVDDISTRQRMLNTRL